MLGRLRGTVRCTKGDVVTYERAAGPADEASGQVCVLETRFQIASVSKQFTAAAVLVLLISVLKPFWVRFSEGLADLAVRILELKARQRWPGLSDRTYEIITKQSDGDVADGGQGKTKDSPREISPPGCASPVKNRPPNCPGGDQHKPGGGWSVPQ